MPTYTYSATYNGSGNFNFGTYWTDMFFTSTANVYSTNSNGAVYGYDGDNTLRIDGTVTGYYYGARLLEDENSVSIGQNGQLNAVLYDALYFSGDENTLLNQGSMSGGRTGVTSYGSDADLENRGTITGSTGVYLGSGEGSVVENSGYIMGNGSYSDSYNSGIYSTQENAIIRNLDGGLIESTAEDGSGVALGGNSDETVVENYGSIRADDGYGVNFENVGTSETATLVNHGQVAGGEAAFMGSEGNDTVQNFGEMTGDVILDEGNDIFRAARGGSVDGVVDGGEGDDLLIGSGAEDIMDGGYGNDSIRGRGGADTLEGGHGWDVVKGGGGNDEIGGSGGDDRLFGNGGHDEIDGGSGNDRINGGGGNDTMTGGMSGDVFIFSRKSGDDRITDFGDGADKLDISSLNVDGWSEIVHSDAIQEFGGGTLIDLGELGGNGSIYLQGVDASDLSGSDFIF